MNLLTNIIFLIITLLTLFKLLINNIKEAKYLILFNKKNLVDERCKIYFSNKDLSNKYLYFCRCFNLSVGLNFFSNYKNLIFLNSIEYFFPSKVKAIISFFLKRSQIKKIKIIDDYRYISLFSNLVKNKIKILGFMHGRFSVNLKNQSDLFKYNYDIYYVWSKYFKAKIIEYNKGYNQRNVIIKKPKFLKNLTENKFSFKKKNKKINILFIEEKSVPFSYFKNIYLKLKNNEKFKIIYKFRPNDNINNKIKLYLEKNQTKFFHKRNIFKIFKDENVDIIFATNSTLIILAPLFKIFPITIKTNYILKDYIDDKLVFVINNKIKIQNEIMKIMKKKSELIKIKNKIWN